MSVYSNNQENAFNEAKNLLSQKSTDELSRLMSNEDELNRFINNLSEVKTKKIQQMEAKRDNLKENVRKLALRNLDQEPILTEGKAKLQQTYEELNRTMNEFKSMKQQYEEQTSEMNPEMLWILLQSAASELERRTEETADDFFYGQRTEEEVTDFERRFIEDRKRAHELKIKAEKFNELMTVTDATSFRKPH